MIFAAGTGSLYFTTDTAAALRAMEIRAEIVLKATKRDGAYGLDPARDPTVSRYDRPETAEAIQRELWFMDPTAPALCREDDLPIMALDMDVPGNIVKAMRGDRVGTLVTPDAPAD